QLVAFAAPRTLQVVQVPSAVDTTSWVHVAAHGDDAAVLAFLDRENLLGLDLRKIAWRLRDRAFWSAVVARLRERLVYDDVVWSYSIHHGDVPAIREYLRHADRFVAQCGRWLQSPLLAIDPVERRAYEHVEFEPLVHARAHRFGPHRRIDNEAVARQYEALLSILADKPRLDDGDWLAVTYHLLLQDRVGDALATFAKVDPARLATRVQYDYLRAYLDFFTEEHAVARGIAAAYADHPIPHWRARFREILAHLDEAEGKVPPPGASPQDALAASEPALELAVQAGKVVVRYRNLTRCTLSFYPMDLELLFSRRPFADQNEGSFAYVRPLRSEEHALPEGASQAAFDLPADLARASVLVEASAGGVVRRQPYHATSMTVQVLESYGQVRVTDAGGKPVSRVYVKVFARDAHGGVRFHKDGYTDLRGRFDYASVSGDPGNAVRFALLVLDDERGAVIREVDPPRR
ncbi:MAG TPA: hypothetical protein VK081_04820, partial [Planctomycetota bacterium]|nr:hypothetical protein [Planctomycetota bacterium]